MKKVCPVCFHLHISRSKMFLNCWNILLFIYRSTARQTDIVDLKMCLSVCNQIIFTELCNIHFGLVPVDSPLIGLAALP
jgi:hypothetical protein